MFQNKISSNYYYRKERMKNMFPEAYDFLDKIEKLQHLGFHLGTAMNLHFYYKESFLLYIKLEPPIRFYLSPEYNGRLKQESQVNNPNLFFQPFRKELRKKNLKPIYEDKYIRIRANDYAEKYFECCFKTLANIAEVDVDVIKGN